MQKIQHFNRDHWLKIQQSLSSLCGLSLHLYDPLRQRPCSPVTNGSPACLRAHESGRESLCQQAYRENVRLAMDAQEILLFKCQAKLCYFVIPFQLSDGSTYAMIGGHHFVSEADRRIFQEEALRWGLSSRHVADARLKSPLKTEPSLRRAAEDLQLICRILLERLQVREGEGFDLKAAYLSTLTKIAWQFKKEPLKTEAHTTLLNTLSILYDLKSACIFKKVPEEAVYRGTAAIGAQAERLNDSEVRLDLLSRSGRREEQYLFIKEEDMLLEVGLPRGTTSSTLFPLSQGPEKMCLLVLDTILSEEDCRIIASFCLQTGSILENRALQAQIEAQRKTIDSLAALALSEHSLKNTAFYTRLLEQATGLLGAEKGSLMVKGEQDEQLSVKAMTDIHPTLFSLFNKQPGEGVSGRVWQSGEALLVKDIAKDERVPNSPRTRYKTSSFLSVPLKMTGENVGVVNVSDRKDGRSFTEDDLSLLEAMGRIMSISIDRAQLQEKTEALRALSITDSLTGLLSRRYFEERLGKEIERTRRHGLPTCLVMVDIDDFKIINDTFGHPMGDKVLQATAKAIRNTLRAIDVAFRYGGEEFAVILPHTSKAAARVISERVCAAIFGGREIEAMLPEKMGLSISAGLASFPEDAASISELVQNADQALYQAKRQGKNQVVVYRRNVPDA